MMVTKYLYYACEITGVMPQTLESIILKHVLAWLPRAGKSQVLLLPNLDVEQSRDKPWVKPLSYNQESHASLN